MEKIDNEKESAAEEIPQIPIKTYQWEDVRRARNKGGYPWTYLTKPPYEEEVDAEMFTMDSYRKSRSNSTLSKSDILDTSESTDVEGLAKEVSQEDIVESIDLPTDKNENQIMDNTENEEVQIKPGEKDIADKKDDNDKNYLSVASSRHTRASSEDPSRKRKLSVESSHSRISLSKLAIKDKLKNAKEKLKIPKILKRSKSDVEENKKPKIQKTDSKRSKYYQATSEPVYIHIPLKLPPGETDEYSKYENESPQKSSRSASLTHLGHFGSGKRKMSLLGLLTELKRIYDEQVLSNESRQERTSKGAALSDMSSSKSLPEKLIAEEQQNLKKSTNKSAREVKEMLAASADTYSVDSDINQYLDKDDKYEVITTEVPNLDIDCVIITDYDEPAADRVTHTTLDERPGITTPNTGIDFDRVRAKSEEPKRKRKSSIDSSYSRKSLSKLAFMKKLKSAKDSIKLPKFLSFTKLDKPPKSIVHDEKEQNVPKQTELKRTDQKKPESPLYIHIPLKLPDGETDKFSHFVDTQTGQNINDEKQAQDSSECETPISPVVPGNDIQLIFLTPPSDDEILDSNIPETPSETDKKFFESLKVDEIKSIAKNAVDLIYPNKKHLEMVVEDTKSEQDAQHGIESGGGTPYWQMHPVLVDVEDGLKLSDAAIAMINEEMAKELKFEEKDEKPDIIPTIKKKVSFKKSRAQDGERIYEDVGLSTDPNKNENATPMETFRSTPADEEKSYPDEHVIQTTSLDEDYHRWSKITDHEYEVVNPPSEDIGLSDSVDTKVNLTLNSTDEHLTHITFDEKLPDETTSEELIEPALAQDFQDEIENRFFKPSTVISSKTENTTQQANIIDQTTQPSKSDSKKKNQHTQKSTAGSNFNDAIKMQADKIKAKLQNIKKPNINLPQPPKLPTTNFSKLKFKKPAFKIPKMPEMPSMKFASLGLTRKDSSKNSWRKRQYSTESNAGDSKTRKFDFRTYPRIFDRSKKVRAKSLDDSIENTAPSPVFATVPRVSRVKVPPEPEEETMEIEKDEEAQEYYYDKTRGLVTIPIDPDSDNALHLSSHIRFNQDINIDDGFNGDIHDTELPEPASTEWNIQDTNANRINSHVHRNQDHGEMHSEQSSPSSSEHRQGVIEEIDSDQFFLREKGISQDDIDVGKYLSSEIKEAFRNPVNALAQLQNEDREYDVDVTDQSQSSEDIPKRKWLKKPKRKKTPHVSNEQLSFECGSDPEDYTLPHTIEPAPMTPIKPKRNKSKKNNKKKTDFEEIIPYQETIPFEARPSEELDMIDDSDLQLGNSKIFIEPSHTYTNEFGLKNGEVDTMEVLYMNAQNEELEILPMYVNTLQSLEIDLDLQPIRPARKNKSVKSLCAVDVDVSLDRTIPGELSINGFKEHGTSEENIIQNAPPSRPNRKRSHTRSESATSLREKDTGAFDIEPTRPMRLRSRTRSESSPSVHDNEAIISTFLSIRSEHSRSRTQSLSTESLQGSENVELLLDNSVEILCIEEPCIQIVCDRMGYAVVDKTKIRDPPLPPPRFPKTPPRTRRKRQLIKNEKFATVPRPPQRPLRNYSTLRKPASKMISNRNILDDNDKENVNINPYIEIDEDEIARRLQSGEVIQKMRKRPLPAPPRPPRKTRTPNREVFRDISHERNLPFDTDTLDSKYSDRNGMPDALLFELEQQILTDDHEETITHAALIVQPIGNSPALSRSDFFNSERDLSTPPLRERIILIEQEHNITNPEEQLDNETIEPESIDDEAEEEQSYKYPIATETKGPEAEQWADDSDEEEASEVPDSFYNLKQPQSEVSNAPEKDEVANLKLQLLDIDKLRVNELTANKIVVTDLEGVNMNVSEINSKAGNLVISGIELPQNAIQEMLARLQARVQSEQDSDKNQYTNENEVSPGLAEGHDASFDKAELPPVPPRSDSVDNLIDIVVNNGLLFQQQDAIDSSTEALQQPLSSDNSLEKPNIEIAEEVSDAPPVRPPRRFSQTEKQTRDLFSTEKLPDTNIDMIEDTEHDGEENRESNDVVLTETYIVEPSTSNFEPTSLDLQALSEALDVQDLHAPSVTPAQELQTQVEKEAHHVSSQPPLSFYDFESPIPDAVYENNIPLTHCNKCRCRLKRLSRSSSTEELPTRQPRPRRLSEPSIPQLTGQLVQSCAVELDRSLRGLMACLTDNVWCNAKNKQDLQIVLLMVVVLIASLILMSRNGKVEHHHHWEYFNPPREF